MLALTAASARLVCRIGAICPSGHFAHSLCPLNDATVRRYHYASHDELRAHLQLILDACNHARRLEALRGLTPYEFICRPRPENPNGSGSIHHTTPRD